MTANSNHEQIPTQAITSGSVHSEGYYEALSRIELALRLRPPHYRDINHYSWQFYLGNPSPSARLSYINNVVICSVIGAGAIFDHHICGSRDPDSSPTPTTSQQVDLTVGGCLADTLHILLSHRPAFKPKITLMEYEAQSELINNFIELADCLISSEQE